VPFTVVHQGQAKDSEYEDYTRLLSRQLLERGVKLDNVPRIKENSGKGWLYVWENEDQASAFAEELKKSTRDAHWHVQPVKTKPSLGPLRPLQINVSRYPDGWAFGWDPLTRKAIQIRYPGSCRLRSVIVGSDKRDRLVEEAGDLRSLAKQVLFLLTGLGAEQLRTFGSFRLVDPEDGTELLPPTSIE
jgi:hypothetical protein